jgi:ABC-type transport system involved in cytochrome c biogenesis permease subunit
MIRLLLALLCTVGLAAGDAAAIPDLPKAIDGAPVLHQGRVKPLAVAAREIVLGITGREGLPKDAGMDLRPAAVVGSMLADGARWRAVPLLPVAFAPARALLGLDDGQRWLSVDEAAGFRPRFVALDQRRARERDSGVLDPLSPAEAAVLELGDRWALAEEILAGGGLHLLPLVDSPASADWLVASATAAAPWAGEVQAARGDRRRILDLWLTPAEVRSAAGLAGWPGTPRLAPAATWLDTLRTGDGAEAATAVWADTLYAAAAGRAEVQHQLGIWDDRQATADLIAVEMAYYRWRPFTWSWVIAAGALVAAAFALRAGAGPAARRWAWWLLLAAALAAALGLAARTVIGGMGAVTNLYETLVFVGFVCAVLGLIFGWKGSPLYLVAGATGATLCALIGDAIPPEQGRALGPLMPVLRNRFWLWTHVKIIVASYAAFLLAWVIGNIVLVRAWRQRRPVAAAEAQICYRCIQVGLVLLIAGTLLGGAWAAESWGRFWGWDPKEVFALVAILVYLIPLHLRYAGVVGPTGIAAWSVLGFLSVVMSWYGVNFLLGAGLHAYAFGSGGQHIVLPLCALQVLWTAWLLAQVPKKTSSAAP